MKRPNVCGKNIDRYLRIASDIDFPFEQRLLQFLERQEHDKNVIWIGQNSAFCVGRVEKQPH